MLDRNGTGRVKLGRVVEVGEGVPGGEGGPPRRTTWRVRQRVKSETGSRRVSA